MELNNISCKNRNFLLLQGPQSLFFKELAKRIVSLGGRVVKINYCGGDVLLFGRASNNIIVKNYRDGIYTYIDYIKTIISEYEITDLLVYSDFRPYHNDAITVCKHNNINVYVFEEGYYRDGFSTLERNGVNGRSSLPKDPIIIRELASKLDPFFKAKSHKSTIKEKVFSAILHHVGNFLFFPYFYKFRTHRQYNIAFELIGILPRYFGRHKRKISSKKILDKVFSLNKDYFLYPLQLNGDSQIQLYSPYIRQLDTISYVLSTFAKNAKEDELLLIKNHPLDNGLINYKVFINSCAKSFNIQDRVFFIEDGDLNLIIEKSKAVVLINSTVGVSALLKSKAVFCLGSAIYALKGLAIDSKEMSLAQFFKDSKKPDISLLQDFLKVMQDRALIEGNFYSHKGIDLSVINTLKKLNRVDF